MKDQNKDKFNPNAFFAKWRRVIIEVLLMHLVL